MRGHCIFEILFACPVIGLVDCAYLFNWLVKKPYFHEKLDRRLDPFMVTLPTKAYVGAAVAAILESYGKFSTDFRLFEIAESVW